MKRPSLLHDSYFHCWLHRRGSGNVCLFFHLPCIQLISMLKWTLFSPFNISEKLGPIINGILQLFGSAFVVVIYKICVRFHEMWSQLTKEYGRVHHWRFFILRWVIILFYFYIYVVNFWRCSYELCLSDSNFREKQHGNIAFIKKDKDTSFFRWKYLIS